MREILRITTKNEKETRKVGEIFAQELLRLKSQNAFLVGLSGELGAGKTVFAKGFAKGLGIKEEMKSPTFILMRVFRIPRTQKHFFHFDAYRIENPKEFLSLGFKKLLADPSNILLVEWSDRVKKILPRSHFRFRLRVWGKNKREIIFYV